MFGPNERDMAATLANMDRLSRERCQQNQVEARDVFREWLSLDKRFDDFDKDALVRRVQECRSNGAVLDLDDPRLKGGAARPLERRYRHREAKHS